MEILATAKKIFRRTREQGENTPPLKETEKKEMELDPFTESFIGGKTDYDGNTALAREKWLETVDLPTLELFLDLHRKDPEKYSKTQIARVLSVLEGFRNDHDFDLYFVSGRVKQTRFNLFPETKKQKIIDDIIAGRLTQYDEKYFAKIVGGGEAYLRKIQNGVKIRREIRSSEHLRQEADLAAFKETGASKEELLTSECPIVTIETHADDQYSSGALERVHQALPLELHQQSIRIRQREGALMNTKGKLQVGDHQIQEIDDRNGNIGEDVLRGIIKQGEKADIVLTGGNLRGCLMETVDSVAKSMDTHEPSHVDLHFLLDQIYDNPSYDDFHRFPTNTLRKVKFFLEIYHDGNPIDVSAGEMDQEKTRVRVYFWSRSEEFYGKIKNSLAIKKLREEIQTPSSVG